MEITLITIEQELLRHTGKLQMNRQDNRQLLDALLRHSQAVSEDEYEKFIFLENGRFFLITQYIFCFLY